MNQIPPALKKGTGRRSFISKGLATASILGTGTLLKSDTPLTKGDADILKFLAALEILETDFWVQYNELGGVQDSQVPGGSGNPVYTAKLEVLDADFPQYIHDNTDDEMTHEVFLNGYLASKGSSTISLDPFRTLQGSMATGSSHRPRLTNLMQLTLDTSWYTRYRIRNHNPDLDPTFVFPQAVEGLSRGKFPAIPRTDADLSPGDHIQAIANTAGFHMPTIEQGGSSLYPSLAQRVTSVEVLRILISIGPTETCHFQTWHDKAGNAPPLKDPTNGLVFPDLNSPPFGGETYQTNLIMPEPCPFISHSLPVCSVVRPTNSAGAAMGALKFLTAMGLFIGQSAAFFAFMRELAANADAATRGGM
jgi:hypothetical protein